MKKVLRVDLKDDYKERFEEIKEANKYNSDAALIRSLIDQFKLGIDQIRISTEMLEKIKQEVQNPLTRIKYGIFNVDDFVLRALINFFEKIDNERGSLLEWGVRSKLTETQREIGIAFFELQAKNASGLTKTILAEFLNKTENEIESDLMFLIKSGLVEKHGDYYYAPD